MLVVWLLIVAVPFVLALFGGPALEAADRELSGGVLLFILIAWGVLIGFGPPYFAPKLAELRILDPGESVKFPLSEAEEPDEETLAELAAQAAQLLHPEGEQDEWDGADWVCSTCRETNARSFELCWKCAAARPEQ